MLGGGDLVQAAQKPPSEIPFLTYQTKLIEPLKEITLQPVEPLAPVFAWPNTYEWGNCTWGVASWIPVPDDLGNANTWAAKAAVHGYQVTTVPKIGAVAQTSRGYWGHVAVVEDVNGSQVKIKEMNSLGLGVIDEQWVGITDYVYIYFV